MALRPGNENAYGRPSAVDEVVVTLDDANGNVTGQQVRRGQAAGGGRPGI